MQLQRFTQLVEGHSIDIWINIDHIESFDEGFNTLHMASGRRYQLKAGSWEEFEKEFFI